MRFFTIFLAVAFLFPCTIERTQAQEPFPTKETILARPVCSYLVNRSNQALLGTLATAPQTVKNGDALSHRENFRLEAGEKKQFCTIGPFYEGQRIELIIRTLIPLFKCRTQIGRDVNLTVVEENGFKKPIATCY
jgi:hypothetical protein